MLCGIDEAGRGCWAGPVVAAAVVFRAEPVEGLADSKALSAGKREALYARIQESSWFGIGVATAAEVDAVNVLQATFLAMRRAVQALPALSLRRIIVDGNRDPRLEAVPQGCQVQTLVKADSLIQEVSAASILAKVYRDRLMADLDLRYPGYGFAAHAGYGVPRHRRALEELGPTAEHRMTFAPLRELSKPLVR